MAPGRKSHHLHASSFKQPSSSYVHPSLRATSPGTEGSVAPTIDDSATVSERIHYLRRVQRPHALLADAENGISQLRIGTPPRNRTAGPPPPRSWLEGNPSGDLRRNRVQSTRHRRPRTLGYFPGVNVPSSTSLLHQTLKNLAFDIGWHLEYDHVYLSVLPEELKELLLSYIASYGPKGEFANQGISILFADDLASGLPNATGAEGVTRLDLGSSIGHAESIKQLEKLWLVKHSAEKHGPEGNALPESWDVDVSPKMLVSNLQFPNLTKLSLAYPGPKVSWGDLLSFSKHLGQLTHLSLAGWPIPHFAASSAGDKTPTSIASNEDVMDIYDEGQYILRLLARETASLTYLSLADCHSWYKMLMYVPNAQAGRSRPSRAQRVDVSFDRHASKHKPAGGSENPSPQDAIFWTSSWKRLRTLDLSQAVPPKGLMKEALERLYARRTFRRPGGAAQHEPHRDNPGLAENGLVIEWHHVQSIRPRFPPDPPLDNRSRRRLEGEAYTIVGPTAVVDSVAARNERLNWIDREFLALDLAAFLREKRVQAGLGLVDVEWSWGEDAIPEDDRDMAEW